MKIFDHTYAVIMAGGSGERFWPQSRQSRPKQFLKLAGDQSLIRQTAERLLPIIPWERIIVVAGQDQADLVKKELPELKHLLLEPMGKNTAPCLAFAGAYLNKKDPDALMIVLPADHYIEKTDLFLELLRMCCQEAAQDNSFITIGIHPEYPETGYGYIKFKEKESNAIKPVDKFVEKPDLATAEKYIQEGCYLWNSGMFVWKNTTLLDGLQKWIPALFDEMMKINEFKPSHELTQIYQKTEKISIDYGLLEKAQNIFVAKGDFGWDDIGSFKSIERHHKKDKQDNVSLGQTALLDTQSSIIVAEEGIVGVVGMKNIIIVKSGNAVIVLPKDRAQDVKKIVDQLKENSESYL